MPKEANLEFKVGIFIVTGLAALTMFIFSISDTSAFKKGKSFQVIFEFANGVKPNAPVCVAGVKEGIVKEVGLFFDRADSKTKALVHLWVKDDTQIPVDSVVTVNQLGLMGEKYIEITPGIDTRNFLTPGQTVVGNSPIPQSQISERVMEVANKVESAVGGMSNILGNETNQTSIRDTLQHLSRLSGNLGDITDQVKSGHGTIGKFFYDDGFYDDLESLSADLKENPWKLLYRPKKK